MTALLLILAPIALIDSTSMIPLAVMPIAALLGGRRPMLGATSFLAGIFVVYTAAGIVLMLCIDVLLEAVEPVVSRWYSAPMDLELVLQIIVGVVMVVFGWKIAGARQQRSDDSRASDAMTPRQAFMLGVALVVVSVPGALPYFGAIDQVLRADLDPAGSTLALLFYNLVFVLPLASPIFIRMLFPERSQAIFESLSNWAGRWGRRIGIVLLLLLGVLLVADGIGFLMGHPILPVGDAVVAA